MSDVRKAVRDRYSRAATDRGCGCGGSGTRAESSSCCGGGGTDTQAAQQSTTFGYSIEELQALPEGADLGLGCGNPTALAGLQPAEVVVDLGSGGGIDCFLAAARVGASGRVIGVDMTAEMIERARTNAQEAGATNVEFRLGEIEHLPVADNTADVIISNCVINLSADKEQVLAEAYRVLRSGGRLLVSDLVLDGALPAGLRDNMALLTGCISGAMQKDEFVSALERTGFSDVRIERETGYLEGEQLGPLAADTEISQMDAARIAECVRSVSIYARKD